MSVPTTKWGLRWTDRETPRGRTLHLRAVIPPASPAPALQVITHSIPAAVFPVYYCVISSYIFLQLKPMMNCGCKILHSDFSSISCFISLHQYLLQNLGFASVHKLSLQLHDSSFYHWLCMQIYVQYSFPHTVN